MVDDADEFERSQPQRLAPSHGASASGDGGGVGSAPAVKRVIRASTLLKSGAAASVGDADSNASGSGSASGSAMPNEHQEEEAALDGHEQQAVSPAAGKAAKRVFTKLAPLGTDNELAMRRKRFGLDEMESTSSSSSALSSSSSEAATSADSLENSSTYVCHTCGIPGHKRSDCPQAPAQSKKKKRRVDDSEPVVAGASADDAEAEAAGAGSGGSARAGGASGYVCHTCGIPGHPRYKCPTFAANAQSASSSRSSSSANDAADADVDAGADADAGANADGRGDDDGEAGDDGDRRQHHQHKSVRVCSYCQEVGHTRYFCFQLKKQAKRGGRGGRGGKWQ